MKNKYYITTPIYYVNDKPHLGHAYTSLVADTVARFKKLSGKKIFFITGTDEHGQKVQEAAKRKNMPPKSFVDKVSKEFINLTKVLKLTNNDFIRTSEERHKNYVRKIWELLFSNGDIYLGSYKGWYSVRDESFVAENEITKNENNEKLGPSGDVLKWLEEPSYFFKLSKWQDKLMEYYENNPDFIKPISRYNEVKSFVRGGLQDLSISRTSFTWGISVPGSSDHVIYVWLDALFNYISALDTNEKFKIFWPADAHIVGKDILKFHAIFWPAFLMSANLKIPNNIFAHGWWTINGEKMSKSLGNVIDPIYLIDKYGNDQIRYFLLREISFGDDGNFSEKALVKRLNSDLTNDLGNLVQRVLSMIIKYNNGEILQRDEIDNEDLELLNIVENKFREYNSLMETFQFSQAIIIIWSIIRKANAYVDKKAPWNLFKENKNKLSTVLNVLVNLIYKINILIQPILPIAAKKIFLQLNVQEEQKFSYINNEIKVGMKINKPEGVFPRIIE
ncbi:MAG: methionine--tRNA ligase [Pelagibacterales bacterium]|nr:methionine--tRNA ligase [Pelagibacterales bacterium]